MLPGEAQILLEKIFGAYGEDRRRLAQDEPEAALVSLLSAVNRYLPEKISPTLRSAVMKGTYKSGVDEARQLLRRSSS